MLRKLFVLTFLGFLTITLIGPVLALIGLVLAMFVTALPFVVVGMLVWAPLHGLLYGRQAPGWRYMRKAGTVCVGAAGSLSRAAFSLRAAGRVFGTILLEVGSGAAVGALLVFLANLEQPPTPGAAFAGIGLGAGVGLLVGLSRLRSARQVEESPQSV
jgi:hypothetical protein